MECSRASHLLLVIDILGVRLLPCLRDRHIIISVYEEVKGASILEEGQEGDRGRDLADDGLDLPHYVLFALLVGLTRKVPGVGV